MIRRSRPLARAVALVGVPLALAAAGAGCTSERQTSAIAPFGTDNVVSVPATVPPGVATSDRISVQHVAMIGDSITVGSMTELEEAFAAIGLPEAVINAKSGRRMIMTGSVSSGLDGIAEVVDAGPAPDLWVIALGTNDVANYVPDDYAAAINELLAAIPPDDPVLWVDTYLDGYQDLSAQFDSVLRQVLAVRGNARVVDWASIAGEDGVLSDGVHPSGFGRDEFARRVSTELQSWMG